jgi:hypothetical protein
MTSKRDIVTPDRVAEALAALEAADQLQVSYKSGHPQEEEDDRWYRAKELVLAAAPVLLKLARLEARRHAGQSIVGTSHCPGCVALVELVEVVLGP